MVRVLGACKTCVKLQFRVTSPDATVYGLFCLFVFVILFALVFVNLLCFACFLLLLLFLFFIFVFVFLVFLVFWGMGSEALIRKNTGVLRGSCTL